MTVCSYHVTYAFQSESTLYSCLNVKELLARNRREIKWLWVRVPLQSLKEVRVQLATLARLLATEYLDPNTLESFVACRLIPLDKNPGVRPIGIGEVTRRTVGKCISWVLCKDIQQAAGPLQTGTGLQGGTEAAIHSMKLVFKQESTDGVILVDSSNAFNSLNRKATLHNIQIICPEFSTVLINTYRLPLHMFIQGGGEIFSVESTTQGDNLAMLFYALGTSILLHRLKLTSPTSLNTFKHNVKKHYLTLTTHNEFM